MKVFKRVTLISAFAAVMVAGSAAQAVKPGTGGTWDCTKMPFPIDQCSIQLTELCDAVDADTSMKDRDRETLVSKVVGAAQKVNEGKFDQADGKLYEMELKIETLSTPNAKGQTKISEESADAISYWITESRSCVDDFY